MKSSTVVRSRFAAGILLVLFGLVTSAFAGPPLICHRLEIADAKSLPWNGSAFDLSANENYDTTNLVLDTLAILDSGAPVIVRMETLRRAMLYAHKDSRTAKELLTRLYQRTTSGHPGALAWFDAGYLTEAYRQWFYKDPNPAAGIDGYTLVMKAISAGGGKQPEMEFAAALMTLEGPHKGEHQEHAGKAIAGGNGDSLLARNLAAQFLGTTHTVSQTLARNVAVGGGEK